MDDKYYRYSLEPCGNGRQYHKCPQCGYFRFTLYIDNETGEPIADDCGRCERVDSCGKHNPPNKYFKQFKKNDMKNQNEPKEVVSEIEPARINKSSMFLNAVPDFFSCALIFFLILIFGEEAVIKVAELYGVMVAKHYYKDGKYGIAFLQIDREGKIRQVKIMAYDPTTGKRLKDDDEYLIYNRKKRCYEKSTRDTPASMYMGKGLMYDKDFVNKQCLFGTHLLDGFPDKLVAIVESEKTALICAIAMPDYVWLATGGKYGSKWTNPEVYHILCGREVTLFPDLKATEDWKIKAESLAMDGINISVYEGLEEQATTEEREKGLDIADFILKEKMQENPELFNIKIENPTPTVKKADVPGITDLFKRLNQSNVNQVPSNKDTAYLEQVTPTSEEIEELGRSNKKTEPPTGSFVEHNLEKLWDENNDVCSDIK